jgi:signal transduction histidine kinase
MESETIVDFLQMGMAAAGHEFSEGTRSREKHDLARLEMERNLREKFISMLSHDLRNPLTAIRASAQVILRRAHQPDAIETMATRIITAVDRSDRMIQDLLDSNLIRAGETLPVQFAPTRIDQIIRDAVTELTTIHGARFNLELPENVSGIWSAGELRRAIENLLNNAIKYGTSDRPVSVLLEEDSGIVRVRVHNWGNPISAEDQNRLFQQYTRLSTAESGGKKGWGLGLTLVRGVAEAHRGRVWLESSPENGTTFILEIPKDSRKKSN